jgi:putative transposase
VIDLNNSEAVAYRMSERPTFDLVSGMLKKVLVRPGREGKPLLHSDQGWRYQVAARHRRLPQDALKQSMSRKDNCRGTG